MNRLLSLLLLLGVLWTGLHLAEPASAMSSDAMHGDHCNAATASADGCADPDEEHGCMAHACHHHCPVAPDPSLQCGQDGVRLSSALLFTGYAAPLQSLAPAPLLEPPAA